MAKYMIIDGLRAEFTDEKNILQVIRKVGINIPVFCYSSELSIFGACRMCVVEIKGARALQAACVYPVNEGMEVFTDTPAVRKSRKTTIELILSNHNKSCLSCERNMNCEL